MSPKRGLEALLLPRQRDAPGVIQVVAARNFERLIDNVEIGHDVFVRECKLTEDRAADSREFSIPPQDGCWPI